MVCSLTLSFLCCLDLWVKLGIIVCHLAAIYQFLSLSFNLNNSQSYLASIFSFVIELLPKILSFSTRHDELGEVDPSFANEIGSLVVIEEGALELVVIRSFPHRKAQFLVPGLMLVLRVTDEAQSEPTTLESARLVYRYRSFWLLSLASWHSMGLACPWSSDSAGFVPCR